MSYYADLEKYHYTILKLLKIKQKNNCYNTLTINLKCIEKTANVFSGEYLSQYIYIKF